MKIEQLMVKKGGEKSLPEKKEEKQKSKAESMHFECCNYDRKS